jgi:hypothetical protein
LGEVEIIELNLSLDQYWIFLTPEGRKVSRPRHPRIVGPPKPSISSTVEIEARLKSTAEGGLHRVDLHPRISRDGRIVSIATYEGLGRQMYVIDIGHILDNPPDGRASGQ